jgi:hypothetical protein
VKPDGHRKMTPEEIERLHAPGESRFDSMPWLQSMEIRPWEPRAEPGEPAWRCGHPKTDENTHGPYPSHSGQCLVCWQWARRRAHLKYLDTLSPFARLQRKVRDEEYKRRRHMEELEARVAAMREDPEAFHREAEARLNADDELR